MPQDQTVSSNDLPPELDRHQLCHLTTRGRITGTPHRIEIWFSLADLTLYLLSGGGDRSDWVRNLTATPEVEVEVGGDRFRGVARVLQKGMAEDRRARDLVFAKYESGYGGDLAGWRETSLAIGVDLVIEGD